MVDERQEGENHFIVKEQVVLKLDDSGCVLCTSWYSTGAGPADGPLWDWFDAVIDDDGTNDIGFETRFNLNELLDDECSFYVCREGSLIDVSRRPVHEAVRAELVALIAKIDAFEYDASDDDGR